MEDQIQTFKLRQDWLDCILYLGSPRYLLSWQSTDPGQGWRPRCSWTSWFWLWAWRLRPCRRSPPPRSPSRLSWSRRRGWGCQFSWEALQENLSWWCIIVWYWLTINCQEGASSDWRVPPPRSNLALILRLVFLACIHHLQVERSVGVVSEDGVANKSRQMSVKAWKENQFSRDVVQN